MASITFKNVVKTYEDGVTVIPGLDLEVKDREFLILVGPSGCGKSTTLRMIAGLEDISGGELYIGERMVNAVPPGKRDIAMVFQSYALYPHMSVYKNMAFGLKLRKMPKDEIDKRVKKAAEMLELEPYLSRRPRALSGGQRQRVALGRAMVREPSVFLLDEPLSNLDAKLRTEMRSRISRLHRELGTTFVYVTHDQTEAMTMADRIVVMKDGVIQQAAPPAEIYEHPANMFVAGFIGSPAMNFIEAVIAEESGAFFLSALGGKIKLPPEAVSALRESGEREVILGVRPEHMRLCGEDCGSSPLIAEVEDTEMTGSVNYIYARADEEKIIAAAPPEKNAEIGEKIRLIPDFSHLHIFRREGGELIYG